MGREREKEEGEGFWKGETNKGFSGKESLAEALKGYRGFLGGQERVPEKLSNLIHYQVWSAEV